MKDISILIPTAKRPHFLRTALKSVARQTALSRVGEIIVIENGEDRSSEEVCRQFPSLPIKYIYRNPPVPPSERTVSVLGEASLPFVALLHDDDWWLDFHLERSLEPLDKTLSISAVYSSYFYTQSENDCFRGIYSNYIAWFGNEKSIDGVTRTLNFKQMLTTNIVQSGFHMSSLIFRNAVIKACFPAFKDHEFDTDRTLAVELSRQGDVFFYDTPSIVVRQHSDQESHPGNNSEAQDWFNKNTRRMIQQARDCSIDLQSELFRCFSRPEISLKMALNYISLYTFEILATEELLPLVLLAQYRELVRLQAQSEAESRTNAAESRKSIKSIAALQKTVDSALRWQQRCWVTRAFHRWRPPGWEKNKKSFVQKFNESLRKRCKTLFNKNR